MISPQVSVMVTPLFLLMTKMEALSLFMLPVYGKLASPFVSLSSKRGKCACKRNISTADQLDECPLIYLKSGRILILWLLVIIC